MSADHGGQQNRNGKMATILFLPCFLLVLWKCSVISTWLLGDMNIVGSIACMLIECTQYV